MILKGKCNNDFLEYYNNSTIKILIDGKDFDDLPLYFQQTLVVNWFDSVGIYIEIGGMDYLGLHFWYNVQQKNTINANNGREFKTREEAVVKAINEAVQIYNLL
jgi:hypothetical protein